MKLIICFYCDLYVCSIFDEDVVDWKTYNNFNAQDWKNVKGEAKIIVNYQGSSNDACVLQVSTTYNFQLFKLIFFLSIFRLFMICHMIRKKKSATCKDWLKKKIQNAKITRRNQKPSLFRQ